MRPKKFHILFAISDTGSGHRSAAVAIKAAIDQLSDGDIECHLVDMLASTGVPLVRDAPNVYDTMRDRWLPLFDLIFRATDGRRRIDMITWMLYFSAHRNVLQVLDQINPQMVVSVHPLTNRFIGNTRYVYRLAFHFVTVVTDLVSLHASWADPQAELCVVPTEEAYQRQIKLGIAPETLVRTGFPVHPKFIHYQRSRHDARQILGITADRFTVLITSGGVDSALAHDLLKRLTQAYPELQFLVVTAKNADLRESLEALQLGEHVHIYGFVHNMEELMGASDLVISKAGPGTLMEALVIGRPVIVTEAVGMQERGNIDFVLNHELGLFCPTIDRIVPAVAELMKPDVYQATTERLAGAVPKNGALEIARLLISRLGDRPPKTSSIPAVSDILVLHHQLRKRHKRGRLRPRFKRLRRLRHVIRSLRRQ